LEGAVDLVYPCKGKPDDGRVTARLIGDARCDVRGGMLSALQLT
jgi:hypothetical protein